MVLAPIKSKTAQAVAHALVTHLICPYTTPRVLLSDNGTEFCNTVIAEICANFEITQTFTTPYHPASNGLVERANRKILEVLRPIVNNLHDSWEDWLPHVAACINSSVNASTGKTPHYILYGVEKRLPYDLLSCSHKPVYDVTSYADQQMKVFSDIHANVRKCLQASRAEMMSKQLKRATPVQFKVGDTVMVQQPERTSKLSHKFTGPYRIERRHGNKFEVSDLATRHLQIVHSDRLKLTHTTDEPTHNYNLRSRS